MMDKTQHTSNASGSKKNFNVMANLSSLERLRQLSQLLPGENRKAFSKKYGSILDLLLISVETSVLNVLAQYWNPALRGFELPNINITPTIEEYACILKLPVRENTSIYFHQEQRAPDVKIVEQFGELLGVPVTQVKLTGHAESKGVTKALLEERLKDLGRLKEWTTFARVLAFAIYGLILFPSAPDIIDQAAMDVFFAVENKQRNPVPAVLAETFLTLNFCQQKQKGKIRCCLHLLYVWIITHMYAGNHIRNVSDPLRSFHRIPIKPKESHEWKAEFDAIKEQSFKWVCPWFEPERGDIVFSCGKYHNVPLMGPRGCISYTPTIALRQLCWTQKKPREEQLGGLYFWYKEGDHTKLLAREVKEAWRNVHMAGRNELGKPLVISTREYITWRKAREVPQSVPNLPSEKGNDSQLAEQIEVMKAQMKLLEQQKQAAELEVIIARSQCEKKERIIEQLKDELADTPDQERERQRTQSLEKEVRMMTNEKNRFVKYISQLKKANEELEMKFGQQKQMNEELEVEMQQQKEELNLKIEKLNTSLIQAKEECDQEWARFMKCRDQLLRTEDAGRFWKKQAGDWAMKAEEWKERHAKLTEKLDHQVSKFVYHFKMAEKEVQKNFKLHLPREIGDFMSMSRDIARGCKRKKVDTIDSTMM